jgi:hypothetical protein
VIPEPVFDTEYMRQTAEMLFLVAIGCSSIGLAVAFVIRLTFGAMAANERTKELETKWVVNELSAGHYILEADTSQDTDETWSKHYTIGDDGELVEVDE